VLSTLSSEFEARVTADRAEKARLAAEAKAKEEAEKEAQALIAQNKKYAEVAISDARSRYDWAASKNAANNYPDLFKEGGNLLPMLKTHSMLSIMCVQRISLHRLIGLLWKLANLLLCQQHIR